MRPLNVGICLPTFEEGVGVASRTLRWPEMLTFTRRAEAVGFDSVWIPDHLLFRWEGEQGPSQGIWEAWSVVAALAATTERIRIGTLVLCTAFRNPALLAKMADTVDEISGGRLILGLGAGYHEPEFHAFGYPVDHRASRFEEALTVMTRLLREGAIDFEGTFVSARDCELRPRAARAGGPPIMVAGRGPRMLRLAAEHADMICQWLVTGSSSPSAIPPIREAIDVACAEVDRDPATLRRAVSIAVVPPGEKPMPMEPGAEPVVGSVEEVVEAIQSFAREGVDCLQVVLNPSTESAIEAMAPVMELLNREGARV
jgi:alkanesulfonate monooxygenase SsuD/methylene tetrahydromethanopterin reductase-like flavin-dependent oxidoreductase (luciferase family)